MNHQLLTTRRARLPLSLSGESVGSQELIPILDTLTNAFGVDRVDLDVEASDVSAVPAVLELVRRSALEASVLLDPADFDVQTLQAALAADVAEIAIRPRAVPGDDAIRALAAAGKPMRLRIDVGLDEATLSRLAHFAVEQRVRHVWLGVARQRSSGPALTALRSIIATLDGAAIPWTAHGLPPCLTGRPGRSFDAPQAGYDLEDYHPAWEAYLTKLSALRGRARLDLVETLVRTVGNRKRLSNARRALERNLFRLNRGGLGHIAFRGVARVSRRLAARRSADAATDPTPLPSRHIAACAPCAVRVPCRGPSAEVLSFFGAEAIRPLSGHVFVDELEPLRQDPLPVPPRDEPRLRGERPRLVSAALSVTQELAAAREVKSSAYHVERWFWNKMNGSIQWRTLQERFLNSSVLAHCRPPFAVRALFAGKASQIGFTLADYAQVMCPMTSDRHRLTLYVAEDGDYVLLRDGQPVEAVELEGRVHRAGRVCGEVGVRLACWSILESLITQEVLVWTGGAAQDAVPPPTHEIEVSVIVVCTKYSRRLQQLVRSVALQQNYDLRRAEMLIAHVPGLDMTEDLIDSARMTWPDLRIVPVRFPRGHAHAKGYMVNQTVARASGRRVLITDADIVLPPDVLAHLETVKDAHFVAVAGRKMIDPSSTAAILLGQRDPVRDFQALRDAPEGELRVGEAKGVPCGYFQCVLRTHFERVPYEELPHFEGADCEFSKRIRAVFGPETVLHDTVVLHLDHSGSRWFGTDRHM